MLFINIFSNVKQTYIHIQHIQAHFSCRTTIAYDKSVFLYCQDIFFFPEWMERDKQYARLQNKEVEEKCYWKTASDTNMIIHLNNSGLGQTPARLRQLR